MRANNEPRFMAGVVALVAVFAACGDDGVGPDEITRENITRGFSAETFTTTTEGTFSFDDSTDRVTFDQDAGTLTPGEQRFVN